MFDNDRRALLTESVRGEGGPLVAHGAEAVQHPQRTLLSSKSIIPINFFRFDSIFTATQIHLYVMIVKMLIN